MMVEEIRSILRLFMEWGIRLKNNDMKKIVKIITIIMIIVIVICGIYYALNKNYFKKKKAVEDDEKNYGVFTGSSVIVQYALRMFRKE